MNSNIPIPEITVGKINHYTSSGEPDYSEYEIEVSTDFECLGIIKLENTDDIVRLRNVLDNFIKEYNLNTTSHD